MSKRVSCEDCTKFSNGKCTSKKVSVHPGKHRLCTKFQTAFDKKLEELKLKEKEKNDRPDLL